jgi:hypothetical protein
LTQIKSRFGNDALGGNLPHSSDHSPRIAAHSHEIPKYITPPSCIGTDSGSSANKRERRNSNRRNKGRGEIEEKEGKEREQPNRTKQTGNKPRQRKVEREEERRNIFLT